MLNFKEYTDIQNLCNRLSSQSILMRDRKSMPQITNIVSFKEQLDKRNIQYEDYIYPRPDSFKPTQNEFNVDKISGMSKLDTEFFVKEPIIISKEFFVLDGHHRWIASIVKDCPIRVLKVDISAENIDDLHLLDDVTTKSINENRE